MNTEELQQLIDNGETLQTEFKSAKVHPEALAAALVSFLNTAGGTLLLGVEDDKSVTGIEEVDTACQRVEQILANNITPRATAYIEAVDYAEQQLLRITVPQGLDRPYQTKKGQCFVRVNAGKRLASREEIRRMYLAVRAFYYDESTVLNSQLSDIDNQKWKNCCV
jgi:ATP-dependent DNA helicase RecG